MPRVGTDELRPYSERKYHEKYAYGTDKSTTNEDKIAKNTESDVEPEKQQESILAFRFEKVKYIEDRGVQGGCTKNTDKVTRDHLRWRFGGQRQNNLCSISDARNDSAV